MSEYQKPVTDEKQHQQAIERFALADEADRPQRKRELEDLEFVDIPEKQWPDEIRTIRKGGTFGTMVVSPRPCLSLPQLDHPIQQVINQAKAARLAIQVNPKSDATKDDAEVRQGLYRNIEVESRAQMARMWAFERAVKCGRGYYRVLKAYANDGDDDQDIIISRILNQHSVYLDPFHQMPDGSDAEWAFIVADIPWARYKREYKGSDLAGYDDEGLAGLGADAPGWVNGDGEARIVRVAEYFTLTTDADGRNPAVKWQKINACEVLEEQPWDGRYIPIVQVIGREININGERRYVGIVGPAKDAQRSYNYMRSAEVEAIGLAPKAPWLVMEGQLEGFEPQWRQSATHNFPYLQYRAKNLGGTFAPPPQRNVAEPAIQAISLASRQAKDDIQTITGAFNESQGKASGSDQSGRAIQALQQQSEEGTSGYLDNLANVSMTYEAKIVLDLMPKIYDRAGRIVKILEGDDDSATSVMVNQPFQRDPQTQQPMPIPPGMPPQPQHEHYDLSKGQFSTTVSIGKSYNSKMQEANAMFGELAQAVPQLVPLFAGPWVRQMNLPGSEEIADRFDRSLPPGIAQKEGEQQDPRIAQQQLQQMQAQMQQMQQALQEAQSGIQVKAMEIQSKEKIAGAELALKQQIAEKQAELDAMKEQNRASLEQQKIQASQGAAVLQANTAAAEQGREHAHDRVTQAVDLHHATGMAHLGHAHAQEQTAHAAALAPEPAAGV